MGGLNNKHGQRPYDSIEDWVYEPEGGRIKQWVLGMMLAAAFLLYGISCLRKGQAFLPGWRGGMEVVGGAARSMAVTYMSVGAFCHFHWFWGLSSRLWRFSTWGKTLPLLVLVPALFWTLYQVIAG